MGKRKLDSILDLEKRWKDYRKKRLTNDIKQNLSLPRIGKAPITFKTPIKATHKMSLFTFEKIKISDDNKINIWSNSLSTIETKTTAAKTSRGKFIFHIEKENLL